MCVRTAEGYLSGVVLERFVHPKEIKQLLCSLNHPTKTLRRRHYLVWFKTISTKRRLPRKGVPRKGRNDRSTKTLTLRTVVVVVRIKRCLSVSCRVEGTQDKRDCNDLKSFWVSIVSGDSVRLTVPYKKLKTITFYLHCVSSVPDTPGGHRRSWERRTSYLDLPLPRHNPNKMFLLKVSPSPSFLCLFLGVARPVSTHPQF